MFGRIFNPENTFFRITGKLVDIVLLSLVWLVVSIPIFTCGPATAALYYAVVKTLRQDEPHPILLFFHSFRDNFKVGALLSILVAVLIFLLACLRLLLYMFATAGGMGYVLYNAFLLLLLFLSGMLSYLFPVLSRFTMGVGAALSNAFKLAMGHLPHTLLLAVITVAGAYLCLLCWPAVLAVPAVVALLHSLLLERLFRPYMPPPPEEETEE